MRKTRAKKRITEPDPKFNDPLVTRFVNGMMYDGKKSLSLKIFYDAIDIVDRKIEDQEGIEVWRLAMNNVMPAVEVKARRVGGATFQIPMEVPQKRKIAVGMKWMINFARKKMRSLWQSDWHRKLLLQAKMKVLQLKKRRYS